MNFSEIQKTLLHLEFNTIFLVEHYNVLQCIQGVGWLLHQLSKSVPTVFPDTKTIPTTPYYKTQNA